MIKKAGFFTIIIVLLTALVSANVPNNQILYIKGSTSGAGSCNIDQCVNSTCNPTFNSIAFYNGITPLTYKLSYDGIGLATEVNFPSDEFNPSGGTTSMALTPAGLLFYGDYDHIIDHPYITADDDSTYNLGMINKRFYDLYLSNSISNGTESASINDIIYYANNPSTGGGGFTTDQNDKLNTTTIPTFNGAILSDSGGTNNVLDINDQITLTTNDFGSNNHNAVDVDFDYVAGSNFAVSTINGINVNMKYSGSGLISNSGKLASFVLDGNSDAVLGSEPFKIVVQNAKSGQSFSEGILSIDAKTSNADITSAYTRARGVGTGTVMGYRGYATNDGTFTGTLIGVDGYGYAINGASGATAVIGLNGVALGGGANVPYNRTMGLKTNAHALIQGTRSSLIVSGATDTSPATVETNHLNFKDNTGEFYVKNTAEFDGWIYLDNVSSTGGNAGTSICIDSNNRLCPCGSCA